MLATLVVISLFLPSFIFYCCSSTVVSTSPQHSPPPHPSPPPTLGPTLFGFVHVCFMHVPWWPFPYFPPLFLSPFPSGYCQFVLYFNVCGYILLACLFCWWCFYLLILPFTQCHQNIKYVVKSVPQEVAVNNVNFYLLFFIPPSHSASFTFRIYPCFTMIIAITFWLLSLLPLLCLHNGLSKTAARRSCAIIPRWPHWLSSYLHSTLPMPAPHLWTCQEMWFLSQGLHSLFFLHGNLFNHDSQTLCLQINV